MSETELKKKKKKIAKPFYGLIMLTCIHKIIYLFFFSFLSWPDNQFWLPRIVASKKNSSVLFFPSLFLLLIPHYWREHAHKIRQETRPFFLFLLFASSRIVDREMTMCCVTTYSVQPMRVDSHVNVYVWQCYILLSHSYSHSISSQWEKCFFFFISKHLSSL